MIGFRHVIIGTVAFLIAGGMGWGAERFPPPEFESGYELPPVTNITQAVPRGDIYEYLDVAVLLAALGLSSYLVLKKRSRRWIFGLMIFSLAYFGFWRKGCVCPIGGIQNVVLSLFDASYAMPVTVTLFFLLPLIFTLFFGRTFCAAVCPLGAIQDLAACVCLRMFTWGRRLFLQLQEVRLLSVGMTRLFRFSA
ncbi:MAG: 4Fe-4S binding protein [Planctomycetota bacterium]|jgi:polyferredoxin